MERQTEKVIGEETEIETRTETETEAETETDLETEALTSCVYGVHHGCVNAVT